MRRPFAHYVLVLSLFAVSTVNAETVEVTITGHWSEGNFKVTGKSDAAFDPLDPKFDGKVFDLSPSDGSLSFVLLVNTDMAVFYPKGSETTDVYGRSYALSHDFYGYGEVTLLDGTYTFGGAVWDTAGVLTRLDGPKGSKATLWTNTDLTKQDPTKVSFRMFGKAGKLSADLFVGSRTPNSIGTDFLLWEYYKGEEIRSSTYTTSVRRSFNF